MKTFIGQIRKARAAFTLMEVNLAIFIMAVGVLAMTSLYPLGFRESEQSRDDVRAAVVADEVLGKLTAGLSSRNVEWTKWRDAVRDAVENGTPKGWFSYCTSPKSGTWVALDRSSANKLADGVFAKLAGVCDPTPEFDFIDKNKYAYGLVAQWGKRNVAGVSQEDYSRVSISFRMARRSGALLSAPIYYTEIHFQGDQKDPK